MKIAPHIHKLNYHTQLVHEGIWDWMLSSPWLKTPPGFLGLGVLWLAFWIVYIPMLLLYLILRR